MLFDDLFINAGSIKDWELQGAIGFFPDGVITYLLLIIFKLNYPNYIICYALITASLILIGLNFIYKKIWSADYKYNSWRISAFLSLAVLSSTIFESFNIYTSYLFLPFFHSGNILIVLGTLCIYFSALKLVYKCIFIFALSYIGLISDVYLLILMLVPFLAVASINLIVSKKKQESIWLVAIIITASAVYYYTKQYVYNKLHLNPLDVSRLISHEEGLFKLSFIAFYNSVIMASLSYNKLLFTIILCTLCSYLYILKDFLLKKIKENRVHFLFILFFCVQLFLTLFSVFYLGFYRDISAIRYLCYSLLLPAIWLINICIAKSFSTKINYIKTFLLIVIIYFCVKFYSPSELHRFKTFKPLFVSEIDSLVKEKKLKNGIAGYWYSKLNMLYSKTYYLNTVYEDGNMYPFGVNIKWYYNKGYDFIFKSGLSGAVIHKNFEVIDTCILKTTDTVLITKPFSYSSETNKIIAF
ncbi:MAG: hypothetical protein JSU07_13170 [Bacteroidetes bacterium]|nr:hypothetical protein [Bacteroidota bacterium]